MHFVIGFFVIFLIGGITGVQLGSVPFDLQVHDTFFVVAHFHYVLLGGVVFPLFAGIYFWWPKVTGRMLSERLGKVNFWLMFLGVHLAFWPQHHLGFMGMPRRVYTYLEGMGWGELNMLSTAGAYLTAAGALVFLINAARSLRGGVPAGPNPWGAETLEWSVSSPPPPYNFRYPPTVSSRSPLWDPDWDRQPIVMGLRDHQRECLSTTLLDARPDHREVLPGPSIVPFLTALATAVPFIGLMFAQQHWVPIGSLLTFVMITIWAWPNDMAPRTEEPGGPEHRLARQEREMEEAMEEAGG